MRRLPERRDSHPRRSSEIRKRRTLGDRPRISRGNRGLSPNVSRDSETGLTYMQARFYDASVGRFLSTDPIHFTDDNPFTFNRYAYANNNPYKYTDPNGQLAFLAPMLIGAGIGAVTSVIVQTAAAGGDMSQVSLGQVAVAAAAGALGGASAVIASTAQSAGGAIAAQAVAGAAIGATSTVASNGVAGVQSTVGGVVAGAALNAAAAGAGARISNTGRIGNEAMTGTERVAAGNLREGAKNATESAGGKFDHGAAAASAANVGGETVSNLPNLQPPPKPEEFNR
jgi:RHS repeat-associated protein